MRVEIIPNMPMADYLKADGVSQSALKHLARSPAHCRQYMDHPEPATQHQKIGTIEHYAVFQPELLEGTHWIKPATYINPKGEKKKWSGNANECKAWVDAHKNRPVISGDEYKAIVAMRDSVFRHPAAKLALKAGQAEQSMFCEDPDTGLQLKCRTDFISGNAVLDLKKCQDASRNGFRRTIENYWYELQAAMNLHVCRLLGLDKKYFIHIAVEDQPPYAVAVWQMEESTVELGRNKLRRLLEKYMECESSGSWPAYSPNIEILGVSDWAKKLEITAANLAANPPMPALEVA